jgi:hypothetical protein
MIISSEDFLLSHNACTPCDKISGSQGKSLTSTFPKDEKNAKEV